MDIHHVVSDIKEVLSKMPFETRPDVLSLSFFYNATLRFTPLERWFAFILAWCLREPPLIEVLLHRIHRIYRSGMEDHMCAVMHTLVRYCVNIEVKPEERCLPPRCYRYLNPTAILSMDFEKNFNLAVSSAIVFGCSTHFPVERVHEKIILRLLGEIHGIGNFSAFHFLRFLS